MSAPKLAEVVTLFEKNASDIAAMLRQAAESVEAETEDDNRTVAIVAVQVSQSGGLTIYGWGQTDSVHAIGTLHLGAAKLSLGMVQQ